MHYLHVIASLNPTGGGPAEGVRQLSAAAGKIGHTMEVVTLDAPGAPWAADMTCPVHQIGPGHLGTYQYSTRLQHWLRANAHRFSAVIVNGLWQHLGFATRQALQASGTPYFVFTHGMLDPWFKHEYPLKHLKKLLYWPWGEYRVLRDARAVLFTCDEERRLARESFGLYRAHEAVVSYGTPGPVGDPLAQRKAFLDAYPQLRGKRILLFLGRLHPKKGCDLLIKAFVAQAHRDPDLHLVVAGPAPAALLAELRSLSGPLNETRITWTGMLAGDLKWGALRVAEAFVLSSHQENFGIAVAEALACNVPVLISDKVNIWREIQTDGAGLTAPDTQAGTTALLEAWLQLGPEQRADMARNAGQCFLARYHIDAAAHSLMNSIEEHLQMASAPAAA